MGAVQVSRIQVGNTLDVTAAHQYLGKAHAIASRRAAVQDGFENVHRDKDFFSQPTLLVP